MEIEIKGYYEGMIQKVFVGMSGGVDSSLVASLLVEQGYEVTGVYMKNWTQDLPGLACPWKEDFQDAKRIAVGLGINFEVFDFEREYRQKVVDYMIAEYKAGRTPNPDIMCNQEIKFKLFLSTALGRGADMIATGHYAKAVESIRVKGQSELHIATNSIKDQTYFLYRISQDALKRSLMPIGNYKNKEQVREDARKRGLTTADKKDSQGICFVGNVGIRDFLKQYVDVTPGSIVDETGKEIGAHEGAIFFTIGQRHGLNVGGGLPYYVSRKDMASNTVYVTTDLDNKSLWSKTVTLDSLHWINDKPLEAKNYQARFRYRGPLIDIKVEYQENAAKIHLALEQRAIAIGQSAVIYDEERVVGGGIISYCS